MFDIPKGLFYFAYIMKSNCNCHNASSMLSLQHECGIPSVGTVITITTVTTTTTTTPLGV